MNQGNVATPEQYKQLCSNCESCNGVGLAITCWFAAHGFMGLLAGRLHCAGGVENVSARAATNECSNRKRMTSLIPA